MIAIMTQRNNITHVLLYHNITIIYYFKTTAPYFPYVFFDVTLIDKYGFKFFNSYNYNI